MSSARSVLYRRFDRNQRLMHSVMMLSFLGLAYTGLPLLFHDAGWAGYLARFFGGFHSAGVLHRTFACIMIGVFVIHVMHL
ncbi:MAG: cytochrome C, partial [Acidobacteria bacterium]|nr:cytochrome C [Acidobacteriota bacterium]